MSRSLTKRLLASAALAVSLPLLATAPASAASRWDELTPASYQGPGKLTWTSQLSWDISGPLAGHPGNRHTGSLFLSRSDAAQPAFGALNVRDESCTGPAGDQVCETLYDAGGLVTLTTTSFALSTGVIQAEGTLADPSGVTQAPGVTAPPLDFAVTFTPQAFTPFDTSGPAAAQHVERNRTSEDDSFNYFTDQDGAATVTGTVSGIEAGAQTLSGSYTARFGDFVDLGQTIPPITSATPWIPFRAQGSVSASSSGTWSGDAPVTSTGFQLPGTTWRGTVNGQLDRASAGARVRPQAFGQLEARTCAPGQAIEDCPVQGVFAVKASPSRYQLDSNGSVKFTGSATVTGLDGVEHGTLPLTFTARPSGTGLGLINTTADIVDGVRQLHQVRAAQYPSISASATLGSLTLAPSADDAQSLTYLQDFDG